MEIRQKSFRNLLFASIWRNGEKAGEFAQRYAQVSVVSRAKLTGQHQDSFLGDTPWDNLGSFMHSLFFFMVSQLVPTNFIEL